MIGQGCRPAHLLAISGLLLLGLLIIGFASYFLGSFVGFVYPAYMSIKAIETKGGDDDKQWLTYWLVYSFF